MKLVTDTKTGVRLGQFCLLRTLACIGRFVVIMHLLVHLIIYKTCIVLVRLALFLTDKWSHKNVSQADCLTSILNSIVCIFFWYILQLCAFIMVFYAVVFGLYYCKLIVMCQYDTLAADFKLYLLPIINGFRAVVWALVLNKSVVVKLHENGINLCSWCERRTRLYMELQVIYIHAYIESLDQNPRTCDGHEQCCPICISNFDSSEDDIKHQQTTTCMQSLVVELPCHHLFHRTCLSSYLASEASGNVL